MKIIVNQAVGVFLGKGMGAVSVAKRRQISVGWRQLPENMGLLLSPNGDALLEQRGVEGVALQQLVEVGAVALGQLCGLSDIAAGYL